MDDDFSYNGGNSPVDNGADIPLANDDATSVQEFKSLDQIRKEGVDSVKVSSSDIDAAIDDDEVVVTTNTQTVSTTENQNVYSIDSSGQTHEIAGNTTLEATYEYDAKKQLLSDFRSNFMQSVVHYPAGFISTIHNDLIDAVAKDQFKHIAEFMLMKDDRKPNFKVDVGVDFKQFATDSQGDGWVIHRDQYVWARGVRSVSGIEMKWKSNFAVYELHSENRPKIDNGANFNPNSELQTFSFSYTGLKDLTGNSGDNSSDTEDLRQFINCYNIFSERYEEYLEKYGPEKVQLEALIVYTPIAKPKIGPKKVLTVHVEKCMPSPIKFKKINPASISDPQSSMDISFQGIMTAISIDDALEDLFSASGGDVISYTDK